MSYPDLYRIAAALNTMAEPARALAFAAMKAEFPCFYWVIDRNGMIMVTKP